MTLLARKPTFFDDDTFNLPSRLMDPATFGFPARFFKNPFSSEGEFLPAVNVKDNTKTYDLEMAVPGFKKEDLRVNIENGMLTVSSEKKKESEEEKNGYSRREWAYSSFNRSFQLPENVDENSIKANFTDGVLKLSIAKTKALPKQQGREVRIA